MWEEGERGLNLWRLLLKDEKASPCLLTEGSSRKSMLWLPYSSFLMPVYIQ